MSFVIDSPAVLPGVRRGAEPRHVSLVEEAVESESVLPRNIKRAALLAPWRGVVCAVLFRECRPKSCNTNAKGFILPRAGGWA